MELNPEHFNRFIEKLGQDVDWQRAHDCPNRDPDSHAHQSDCRICRNGRIWDSAVAGVLALSGQKVARAWQQSGLWENGDVVCTLPSDTALYAMGEYDRVLFKQSSLPFSTVRVNTGTQNLGFPLVAIDRVFWSNVEKTAIVAGSIPTVSPTGDLTWASGGPPAGVQYTLSGRKRPEYFCYKEFPQDRAHHHGKTLPRRVVLRSFDLYGRAA